MSGQITTFISLLKYMIDTNILLNIYKKPVLYMKLT